MQTTIIIALLVLLMLAVMVIVIPPWREGQYNRYWRLSDQAEDLNGQIKTLISNGDVEKAKAVQRNMNDLIEEASRLRRNWRLHTRDGA